MPLLSPLPLPADYIATVQERLVNEYRFPPYAIELDANGCCTVPDGNYPMRIDGHLDLVGLDAGQIRVMARDDITIRRRVGTGRSRWATLLDCCRKRGEPAYMVHFQGAVRLWLVHTDIVEYEFLA